MLIRVKKFTREEFEGLIKKMNENGLSNYTAEPIVVMIEVGNAFTHDGNVYLTETIANNCMNSFRSAELQYCYNIVVKIDIQKYEEIDLPDELVTIMKTFEPKHIEVTEKEEVAVKDSDTPTKDPKVIEKKKGKESGK